MKLVWKALGWGLLIFSLMVAYRIYRIYALGETIQPPSEANLLYEEYKECQEFARSLQDKPYSAYTARDTDRIEGCLAIKSRLDTIRRPK